MAEQTVRTIYEADVSRAQQSVARLAGENEKAAKSADKLSDVLDDISGKTVKPKIDVAIDAAEKDVKRLRATLDDLSAHPADVAVEADIAKTQSKIEQVTRELQVLANMDPSPKVTADTEKAEASLTGLTARLHALEGMNAGATATVDIDQARTKLDQAESRLKALNGAKAEMQVVVDADSVSESLDGMTDAAADSGEDAGEAAGHALLDGINSVPIVGTIASILAAAGIVGAASLKRGFDVNAARDLFGAKTGLDEATARRFATAAGTAYADAWGESVEANLETARIARENGLIFSDDTEQEIARGIAKLSGVSEMLGVEIPEAAEAAGTMIKNGLAGSADEAFDIIVTGYQAGLDRSGDFLDTLREYSPMFASLGLDGQQALGLIDQAMQSGARNSDLAADALKEFSIRAQDGSKTTTDAFKSLGLDAGKMGADVAAGGDRASGALDVVLDALRGVTDEQERNRIGVELFGTQWEDLGNGANVLAMDLDGLASRWTQTGDTADQALARMSDNAASHLESAKRSVEMALTDVGGGLAEAFDKPLSDLADWVSTHQGEITQFLADMGNGLFEVAKGAIEWGATMVEVGGHISGALAGIVNAIGVAVEGFGVLAHDESVAALGRDIQGASDGMQTLADNAPAAAKAMRDGMIPAIQDTQDEFNAMVDPAILQANLHDATAGMLSELDAFKSFVSDEGVTLTINGEVMDAENALNWLVSEVNASNGTVEINGETVPADRALEVFEQKIAETDGTVTVEANTDDAYVAMQALWDTAALIEPTVPVQADTAPAGQALSDFEVRVNGTTGTMYVHASTAEAEQSLTALEGAVNSAGGTITVNGDTLPAAGALQSIITEVDSSNGTVTINGQSVPADQALNRVIAEVNAGRGTITINGNRGPADAATNAAVSHANSRSASIQVGANTAAAVSEINSAARDRHGTIYMNAVIRGASAIAAMGARADGGLIAKGLAAGGTVGSGYGYVPAPYPGKGVDNVLWPLAHGGRTLSQPLAGGEFVMNPIASAANGALLEYLNAGGKVQAAPQVGTSVTNHFHEVGGEAAEIAAHRVVNQIARSVRRAP